MPVNRILRLFTAGIMVMQLTLGFAPPALAAGNYNLDKIVWSKSECKSNSRRIWRMNDDGGSKTLLTQSTPAGYTDEHPVWSDDDAQVVFTRNGVIYKMSGVTGEAGGLTLLTLIGEFANHPFVFGSKVYYSKRNVNGIAEIWRMNLSDGSGKEQVVGSGALASENKYHPTVATYSGTNYLVYVEGDVDTDKDNKIKIRNLSTSATTVLLDGADLTGTKAKDIYAPSIMPGGNAVLYSQTGLLLGDPPQPPPPPEAPMRLRVKRLDLNGTPMDPINPTTDTRTILTDTYDQADVTPYADWSDDTEMDFVRISTAEAPVEAEIFYKTDLTTTTPEPENRSNDAANIDTIVVEKSACNAPDPVPCPAPVDSTSILGYMAIMAGGSILIWQRRYKSRGLV
ncbi:MAG: hypothetical protein Q8L35_08385 [Actinomycetota bacterium]|nr:hypothetical protein [Actinomycetota bacterium]